MLGFYLGAHRPIKYHRPTTFNYQDVLLKLQSIIIISMRMKKAAVEGKHEPEPVSGQMGRKKQSKMEEETPTATRGRLITHAA